MTPGHRRIGLFEVLERGFEDLRLVRAAWPWALLVYFGTLFASAGLTFGGSLGLSRALATQLASWWVVGCLCLLGAGLFAVHLLTVLLVGAGVIPLSASAQGGQGMDAQAVLRIGFERTALMLKLWAHGLLRLGLMTLSMTVPVVAVISVFSANDTLSGAIIGVLAALVLTLAFALSGAMVVSRYALSWPILVVGGGSASEALKVSRSRLRGRAILVLGLVLLLTGVSGGAALVLGLMVPSPETIDLNRAELIQQVPLLFWAQLKFQTLATGVLVLVSVYGSACFGALLRLTDEE